MNPYRAASAARRRLLTRVRDNTDWFLLVLLFAGGLRMFLALLRRETWGWELAFVAVLVVVSGCGYGALRIWRWTD